MRAARRKEMKKIHSWCQAISIFWPQKMRLRVCKARATLAVCVLPPSRSFHFNIRVCRPASLWSNYLHFNLGLRPRRRGFSDVIYKRRSIHSAGRTDGRRRRPSTFQTWWKCVRAPQVAAIHFAAHEFFKMVTLSAVRRAHTCIDSGGWPLKDHGSSFLNKCLPKH